MAKFRKKPVEIDAWPVKQLLDLVGSGNWQDLPRPVKDALDAGKLLFALDGLSVDSLEGWMSGKLDDWLIMGVKRELYPCKPDVFALTYTPVADEESPVDAPSTLLHDVLGAPGPASELVARLTRELKAATGEARAQAIRVDQAESEATELAKKIAQLKTENNGLRRDIKRLEGQLEHARAKAAQQP